MYVNRAQGTTDALPGTPEQWQAVRDEVWRLRRLVDPE